jgi:AraC-like DNA-binding protein
MEPLTLPIESFRSRRAPHASQARVISADALSSLLGIESSAARAPTGHENQAGNSLDLPYYCALLELAAQKSGNDVFGLEVGRDSAPHELGLAGAIALASPTLGDALANLARYLPYQHQNTATALIKGGAACRFEYRILDGRILHHRQDAELTISTILNLMRRCLGKSWAPDEVHFEHPKPQGVHLHRQMFDAPVFFSMGANLLAFRDPGFSRPMPDYDPERLETLCGRLLRLSGSTGVLGLTDQVAGEIRSRLPSGYPHIDSVADALRMTRWTLQRRLAEHGEVFSDLVESTRRGLTEVHLAAPHMSIREIADLLGYSELSAFTRACVRWFGAPPSRVRERILRENVALISERESHEMSITSLEPRLR